jgi:hypothetical protein
MTQTIETIRPNQVSSASRFIEVDTVAAIRLVGSGRGAGPGLGASGLNRKTSQSR